jgi:hypothetical protein
MKRVDFHANHKALREPGYYGVVCKDDDGHVFTHIGYWGGEHWHPSHEKLDVFLDYRIATHRSEKSFQNHRDTNEWLKQQSEHFYEPKVI